MQFTREQNKKTEGESDGNMNWGQPHVPHGDWKRLADASVRNHSLLTHDYSIYYVKRGGDVPLYSQTFHRERFFGHYNLKLVSTKKS